MLTGGTVFFLDGSTTQVSVGVFISMLSLCVYAHAKPYKEESLYEEERDNGKGSSRGPRGACGAAPSAKKKNRNQYFLAMCAQLCIFLTLFEGMILKAGVADKDGYSKDSLGVILAICNSAVILLAVVQVFFELRSSETGLRTSSSGINDTVTNPMRDVANTATPSDSKQLKPAKGGDGSKVKLSKRALDIYAATNPATQGTGDDSDQKPTAQL